MATRDEIVRHLDSRLDIAAIDDFSHNGLQVQGAEEVRRIGLTTDAAMAVYRRAEQEKCEMIVAHHGIIWGGGITSITGRDYNHIKFLLDHELSLYAAHLPLDLHPELGNNAELCRMLDVQERRPFGKYHGIDIGFGGVLASAPTPFELAALFQRQIGGEPLILPFGPKRIRTVGIVSGGGSSALPEAIEANLDCFVTGEGKHEDHHLVLESNINMICLGHYHSETVGVKAVGEELARRFDVEVVFIDEPTLL